VEQVQQNVRSLESVLEFDPRLHSEHTPNGTSTRKKLLDEALRLITEDRHESYGSPTENFQDTANLWNTYLRTMQLDQESGRITLEPHNIADLMILLKIARNMHAPSWDNYVDIAGYGACGAEAANLEP
jgi:hypothetical protein